MRKRTIEKMLQNEASLMVPNIKETLLNNINQYYLPTRREVKRRFRPFQFVGSLAAVSLTAAVLMMGILSLMNPTTVNALTYVSIDINPSIELWVNQNNIVTSYRAMNDDAEVLLFEHDFTNLTVDEATVQIVSLARDLGYIDDTVLTNDIVVTTVHKDEAIENKVADKIEQRLKGYFTAEGLENVIQLILANKDRQYEDAHNYGLSMGHYALISKAMQADATLTLEQAMKLDVKSLNEKSKQYDQVRLEDIKQSLGQGFEEVTNTYKNDKENITNRKEVLEDFIEELDDIRKSFQHGKSVHSQHLRNRMQTFLQENRYNGNFQLDQEFTDKYQLTIMTNQIKNFIEDEEQLLKTLNRDFDEMKRDFQRQEKDKYHEDESDEEDN